MAEEKGESINANETEMKEASGSPSANSSPTNSAKKRKGLMSRLWSGIFRQSDDLEKRLQQITKEEAVVLARLKRRSVSKRSMTRNLIVVSVVLEAIAVGYAIMTTRTMDMEWKVRAFRVLPMFLLPALSAAAYSALISFIKMCDRKDQNTLERLRTERQEKIDELKERTNYYTTQQLIQRYDTDPAAKAAATTILASKLGADSGLTMYFGDDSKDNASTEKDHNREPIQPSGMRNRKQYTRSSSTGSSPQFQRDERRPAAVRTEAPQMSESKDLVVDHYTPEGSTSYDGGWLARFAALLVGEDPTQSYALVCGNCRMHNGLARKEDFPYITYYCPHCHALNKAQQSDEPISRTTSQPVSGTATPNRADTIVSSRGGGTDDMANIASGPVVDGAPTGGSPLKAVIETEEEEEEGEKVPAETEEVAEKVPAETEEVTEKVPAEDS